MTAPRRADRFLLAIAGVLAVLALIVGDVDAQGAAEGRPTRDGVEPLPVWGVELCLPLAPPDDPAADRPACRWFAAPEFDAATCRPIARAAQARFKGAAGRCVVDPVRLLRVRGLRPGAPLSGLPSTRTAR